jgi:hypothetical protein
MGTPRPKKSTSRIAPPAQPIPHCEKNTTNPPSRFEAETPRRGAWNCRRTAKGESCVDVIGWLRWPLSIGRNAATQKLSRLPIQVAHQKKLSCILKELTIVNFIYCQIYVIRE